MSKYPAFEDEIDHEEGPDEYSLDYPEWEQLELQLQPPPGPKPDLPVTHKAAGCCQPLPANNNSEAETCILKF